MCQINTTVRVKMEIPVPKIVDEAVLQRSAWTNTVEYIRSKIETI